MNIKQLRVLVGAGLVNKYKQSSGLRNAYLTREILIQTHGEANVVQENGETRSIIFGTPQRFVRLTFGKDNSIEMSCDRYGQMDLYYQKYEEGFVFGTDLSLLPFRESEIHYDAASVAHSLNVYGFRPPKRHTLYKNVKRLGVGESAVWQNGILVFKQLPPTILPAGDYGNKELKKYSELLLEAVEQRSSPKDNVVYLSSGWDSTSLLACLVKLHGPKKVRAVIGRLKFSERSGINNPFEIERAQKVADYFKVPLEVVDSDWSSRGPDILEELQPFMRSHMLSGMSFFNWAHLAKHVSKTANGDEALFSGEISDGAHNLGFSQFTTLFHSVLDFREYSDKMASYLFGPTFLKSLQNKTYTHDVIYKLLKQKFDGVFDEVPTDPTACMRQLFASFFLRSNRFPFWSLKNARTLTDWGRKAYSEEMESIYLEEPSRATPETLYSWFLHLYNSFHWQGGTVATLALTADYYGLNMHLPFWDERVQTFLAAMPEHWGRGLDLKPTKYPLKWMLENCIDYPLHLQVGPHSYLYDVNPNFNHAGEFIYASQFTPTIKKSMSEGCHKEILSPEVFDTPYFEGMVANYLKGEEVISERTDLSALSFLSLTGWY